jgi:hypothetical protein
MSNTRRLLPAARTGRCPAQADRGGYPMLERSNVTVFGQPLYRTGSYAVSPMGSPWQFTRMRAHGEWARPPNAIAAVRHGFGKAGGSPSERQ